MIYTPQPTATMAQQHIQIPQRHEDEPPASPQQLQQIRQLTSGLALQGYRFDYRKLGDRQAKAILNQLHAMNEQPATTQPKKQGPGCITSLAKGTTALIVWLVVLASVAGGAYLIYWKINQNPQAPSQANQDDNTTEQDDSDTTIQPDNNRSTSKIFEGLGTSDAPTPLTQSTPDQPVRPTIDPNPPVPTPSPIPALDRALSQQINDLEKLLVQLSQYTRSTFTADVRTQSSQAMQRALDNYPQALAALDQLDPTLSPRIRAAVEAFAAQQVDGPRLRDEITAIRQSIDKLKTAP